MSPTIASRTASPKELQPFVVDLLSLAIPVGNALMHQRDLIEGDVMRHHTKDMVYRQIKLLILSEREPYSIDDIIQHTS